MKERGRSGRFVRRPYVGSIDEEGQDGVGETVKVLLDTCERPWERRGPVRKVTFPFVTVSTFSTAIVFSKCHASEVGC